MQQIPESWSVLQADESTMGRLRVRIAGAQEYGPESIVECSRLHYLFDQGPGVGNACAAELTLTIVPTAVIPKAARVEVELRLENAAAATDYIPQGTFWVSRREPSGRQLTLTCYDAMLRAEQDFFTDEPNTDDWPKEPDAVVAEIAARMGVELDSRTVLKSGEAYRVEMPWGKSLRTVLQEIAAVQCGNWTITDAGALRLVPLAGTGDALPAVVGDLDADDAQTVTGVRLWVDDGSYFAAGTTDGALLEASATDATQAAADALYAAAQGLEYRPYTAQGLHIDPAGELGDDILINGVSCRLCSCAMDLGPSCVAEIAAPAKESETEDEYPYATQTQRLQKAVGQLATSVSSIQKTNESISLTVSSAAQKVETMEKQIASGELDGADAIVLTITSSAGTVFQNATGSTILYANVFVGGKAVTVAEDGTVSDADGRVLGVVRWYLGDVTGGSEPAANASSYVVSASGVDGMLAVTAQLEETSEG